MYKPFLYCLIIIIATSSCGVRRYLPEGERLYRGATIKIEKEKDVSASSRSLNKQLRLAARPGANKFALGNHIKYGGGLYWVSRKIKKV